MLGGPVPRAGLGQRPRGAQPPGSHEPGSGAARSAPRAPVRGPPDHGAVRPRGVDGVSIFSRMFCWCLRILKRFSNFWTVFRTKVALRILGAGREDGSEKKKAS